MFTCVCVCVCVWHSFAPLLLQLVVVLTMAGQWLGQLFRLCQRWNTVASEACYLLRTQIYFITVFNADCRVFTFIARDCLIEIIKGTDSSLDQKAHFYISSWLTGNRFCFWNSSSEWNADMDHTSALNIYAGYREHNYSVTYLLYHMQS